MMLLLTPEWIGSTGVYHFRLSVPSRPSWGSVAALSGNPATQVLSRLCDWRPGLPIPEGEYLVGPLDVARLNDWGRPDWETRFGGETGSSMCRDLLPALRHGRPGLRYALRTHPGTRKALLSSDVYLVSQCDWERFYDWSVRAPLDMMLVQYGLGSGREPRRMHPRQLSRLHLLNRVDF